MRMILAALFAVALTAHAQAGVIASDTSTRQLIADHIDAETMRGGYQLCLVTDGTMEPIQTVAQPMIEPYRSVAQFHLGPARPVEVPEPSTLVLLVAAVLGLRIALHGLRVW